MANWLLTVVGLPPFNSDGSIVLVHIPLSLQEAVKKWISNGADGFQLRDFAMVGSSKAERATLVQSLFSTFNETQSDAESKKCVVFISMCDHGGEQFLISPG